MKNIVKILAVCVTLFAPIAADAQNLPDNTVVATDRNVVAAPAFKSVAYVKHTNTANLEFTVCKIQNIRNYRIEAGNNPDHMEMVGLVMPQVNTPLPVRFSFVLGAKDAEYRYFRIVEVSMAQEWATSGIVENPANDNILAAND